MKEIGKRDTTISLSVYLDSTERSVHEICTIDYQSRDWIPRFSCDRKIVYLIPLLGKAGEYEENIIGVILELQTDNSVTVQPDLLLDNLLILGNASNNSSNETQERPLNEIPYDDLKNLKGQPVRLKCKAQDGDIVLSGTVEYLKERPKNKIQIRVYRSKEEDVEFFSVNFQRDVNPFLHFGEGIVQTIDNPDDRATEIRVDTLGFYRNVKDGVLCTEDGTKLGAKAVEYYIKNHGKKIEQKRAVEEGVFLPLEREIDDTDAATYNQRQDPTAVKKRVFATEKKTILLTEALLQGDLYLSDSDNDLSESDKKEDFKMASQFILEQLKQKYSQLKKERKEKSGSGAGAGSVQSRYSSEEESRGGNSVALVGSEAVAGIQGAEAAQSGPCQKSPHEDFFRRSNTIPKK